MKVRCICGRGWIVANKWYRRFFWSKRENPVAKGPKKDDIVTVLNEMWIDGELCYHLKEWPHYGWYDAKKFVPLQESTTELKEVTYSEIKKEVPVSAN